MFELPEVLTIARQMGAEIAGKRVASCVRGNHAHKWVFYSRERELFEGLVAGKTVTAVRGEGKNVYVSLGGTHTLIVGDTGGRITFHRDAGALPKSHHLLLGFDDGSYLSVVVQGWGFIHLFDAGSDEEKNVYGTGISPVGDEFTYECFQGLLDAYEGKEKNSAKAFLVQRPKIAGIGNGYLHDILFRAGVQPKRKAATLTPDDARRLHAAVRETMEEATRLGGRDTERDLYGERGQYIPILDKRMNDKPCPRCGTFIQKISFLGGSCYFCTGCQE